MSKRAIIIVRRYYEEFFNQGMADVADEIFASPFLSHPVWHSPVQMVSGAPAVDSDESTPEEEKAGLRFWLEQFPDSRTIIDDLFEEALGDRVVVLWTGTGTHRSGKSVTIKGIDIHRVARGKIVEFWTSWDRLGMWQQLGVVPSTPELRAQVGMI